MKNKNKKILGFTMIELLIVIVILGILSVIGLGSFTSAQSKSRDSKRKSSLNGVVTALEVYYNDHGGYPDDNAGVIVGCGPGGAGATDCSYGSIWDNSNGTVYMVQLPVDPSINSYYYISDTTEYQLYARLENVNDRDVPVVLGAPGKYGGVLSDKCGGNGCNYGVSSNNSSLASTVAD